MMRKIGWRERARLVVKKRKLAREERTLCKALGSFSGSVDGDRVTINALLQKRCDLADQMLQIGRWLVQGSRPIVFSPTGKGKGLPAGTLPLSFSNKDGAHK